MKSEWRIILLVLFAAFITRALLFPMPGYKIDTNDFVSWMNTAREHGVSDFYQKTWSDYPPMNVYLFWALGNISQGNEIIVLKITSVLFDLAAGVLIFYILREKLRFKKSFTAFLFYVFNPATIFNTAIWGQLDSIYAFFLLLSIYFLAEKKVNFSAIAFAVSILLKPQAVFLTPMIFFILFKDHHLKGIRNFCLVGLIILIITITPFKTDNHINFLQERYFNGYSYYAYTSINAYNIWAFSGFWKPDTTPINYNLIGWLLFGAFNLFLFYKMNKSYKNLNRLNIYLFSSFIILASFMLLTRMHERYMLPVFAFMVFGIAYKEIKLSYIILAFTSFFNLWYVLDFLNRDAFIAATDPTLLVIPAINCIIFVATSLFIYRGNFFRKPIGR